MDKKDLVGKVIHYYDKISVVVIKLQKGLKVGDKVIIPKTAYKMKKRGDFNADHYKTWYKNPKDYKIKTGLMDDHFEKVIKADAVLIVNNKKHGLKGYIGGNVLMEIALAYYFKKSIFILNEISNKSPFKEEILGVNPIFLNGHVEKIDK